MLVSLALVASVFVELHPFTQAARFRWRVDPSRFLQALPSQWGWFLPFVVLAALQLPARALQWQGTLRREVPFSRRYHWVAIGAFVNNALPGKLGDVSRAWLLAREEGVPFVESLGSVAVCKLLELVALILLAALTLLSPSVPPVLRGGLKVAACACVALCLGVLGLAHFAGRIALALRARGGWARLTRFFQDADAGLSTLRRPSALGRALAVSSLPVLAPALGYGLALSVMGVPHGWVGGPLVLLAITVGQSVMVIPAGVGLYFVATQWSAQALGATAEQAAVLATLTEVALIAAQCGLGALSLWRSQRGWAWLGRIRAEASQAQVAPVEGR
jgi:hypothetical protein